MKFQQLTCWPTLFVVASVFFCSAKAVAQENPFPAPDPQVSSDAQPPAQQQSGIVFNNRRLTVEVEDRPLMEVLNDISRLARVAIVPGEDFSRHRISVRFENLALEDGLRRILVAYDSFFFFGIDDAPPASVKSVWVYSRGGGRGIAPVPPQIWASATELRDRLAREDAEDRAAAIEALVEREGHLAQSAVLSTLADPEAKVRARALYAAMTGGVDVPAEVLLPALEDASVDVRFLALQALADGPMAQAAAERARYDPSPLVRQLAAQVMKRLAAASRKPQPAQSRSEPPKR